MKNVLFMVITLLFIVGTGCEKGPDWVFALHDFTPKPCVELDESALFKQQFHNVQGVITKNGIVSFGGSHYCIKAPSKMFFPSDNPSDSITIYPACIQLTEKDLNKKIRFSGKLYFTQGYAGNYNMLAHIFVFTNK